MMYLYNSNQEINSSNQVPYSPDLPNLASCTADNYDANNAWQITTVHDLNNLSTMSAADKSFEGKTIYLANDITYPENLQFTQIKKFSGIFDGMGHRISGINISLTTAAIIKDLYGTVKNVTFENGLISGSYAGGIVYTAHGGSILENCTNASKIEVITSVDYTSVGGIVALIPINYETPNTVRISNCVNLGEIHVENSRSHVSGKVYDNNIGGIVGNSDSYDMILHINNCKNKGNISITVNGNFCYAGGIIGESKSSKSSITNCHNSGDIIVDAPGDNVLKIGGIAGSVSGILDKCVNEGDVSGTSNYAPSESFVSGIATTTTHVTNCHNYGNVLAVGGNDACASGIAYQSDIRLSATNCSNYGDVKSIKRSNEEESGSSSATGISTASAIYCYNFGDVSAISEVYGGWDRSYTDASGVASSTTIGSFNAGTVIARGGDSNIAAGISEGQVVNCSYNLGLVAIGDIGTSEIYPISKNFVNSYYLKGVVPEDTTGVLTQEEMQSESFLDLLGREYYDTNRIKFTVNGELYAYPVLAWQTYYANFVEFDSNGGSEVEAQYVTSGDVATYPDIPTKQNKVFYYWKDSNGQEYDFDTIVSSDLKLTAEWYDKLMFISYPPNSGGM